MKAYELVGIIARMKTESETDGGFVSEDAFATLNDLIATARWIRLARAATGPTDPAESMPGIIADRECAQCHEERCCQFLSVVGPLGTALGKRWICDKCAAELRRNNCALQGESDIERGRR